MRAAKKCAKKWDRARKNASFCDLLFMIFHWGYQLGSLGCDFDHEMRFIMQRNGITLSIYFMVYHTFLTKEFLSLRLCNRDVESFVFICAQWACLRFIFDTAYFFSLLRTNGRMADGILLYKLKCLAWQSSHRTATQIQKGKANDGDDDNSRQNNINVRMHTFVENTVWAWAWARACVTPFANPLK